VNEIRRRQKQFGLDAVTVGWGKARIGVAGNKAADKKATRGEKVPKTSWIVSCPDYGRSAKPGMDQKKEG